MKIDCSELFPDSHLHLLVWDRLDDATHKAGLDFMCDLMKDASLSGQVMPLLRPWRRAGYDHYGFTGIIGTCDNPSCELWLQVAGGHEGLAWDAIADWSCSHVARAIAMRSARVPLWEPLSGGYPGCEYCEGAGSPLDDPRQPHQRWQEAVNILQRFQIHAHKAWLLKIIWYRATEVIKEHVGAGGSVVLHPYQPAESEKIIDLLAKMLSPLTPKKRGIPLLDDSIDPSAFAVSHMSVFAVNAVTPTDIKTGVYKVEDYLGHRCVTHPYAYRSREDYLTSVQTLTKLRWGRA